MSEREREMEGRKGTKGTASMRILTCEDWPFKFVFVAVHICMYSPKALRSLHHVICLSFTKLNKLLFSNRKGLYGTYTYIYVSHRTLSLAFICIYLHKWKFKSNFSCPTCISKFCFYSHPRTISSKMIQTGHPCADGIGVCRQVNEAQRDTCRLPIWPTGVGIPELPHLRRAIGHPPPPRLLSDINISTLTFLFETPNADDLFIFKTKTGFVC